MGDVVDFNEKKEENEPHVQGEAKCMNCKHLTHAVAPAGTTNMECSECGAMKVVFLNPILSVVGNMLWVCDCGNEFFVLDDIGLLCAQCGTRQRFDD